MNVIVLALSVSAIVGAPWKGRPARTLDSRSGSGPGSDVWLSQVRQRLQRAGVEVDAAMAVRVWVACSFLGMVVVLFVGGVVTPMGGVLGAVAGAAVPLGWVISRGDRESRLIAESLPELLELLARSLRGGADLHGALADLAVSGNPAGRTLKPVLRRVEDGGRLGEALDQWVVDLGHRDASVVRAVVRLGDSTGGSMAPALDRAAATIRERSALRGEIRALTSQSRASALVISLSPLGFLLVVAATDPKTSHVLFSTAIGRVCLVGGLALDGLGLIWMSRLTAGVEQ